MTPAETRTSDMHELRKGPNPIFASLRRGNQAWFRWPATLVHRKARLRATLDRRPFRTYGDGTL